MNTNYDIIILPTLFGFKNPSFVKFQDGSTLLQKQIEVLDNCFERSNIILVPNDQSKYQHLQYCGHNRFKLYINNCDKNFDSAKIISKILGRSKYSKTIIVYNNIYLTDEIFDEIPEYNCLFVNDLKQGNISIIQNEGIVENMFWNVGIEWSNILYLHSKKEINTFKSILKKCHKNEFLFEGINKSINQGFEFRIFSHEGEAIKITKKNDTKKAEDRTSNK